MLRKTWLLNLIALAFLVMPSGVFAQDYVPPPMFGDPIPLDPSEYEDEYEVGSEAKDELALDPASYTIAPDAPLPPRKPIFDEAVTVAEQKIDETPIPQKKPAVPQSFVLEQPIIVVNEDTDQAAANVVKQQKKVIPGVVTGPKTMPSVPAEDFVTLEVYEDDKVVKAEETILERHEKAQESSKTQETAKTVEIDSATELQIFDLADSKAKKIVIPYAQGQDKTPDAVIAAIQKQSLGIFKDLGEQSRLQIKSYATPYDQGLSSDRRMSLNRALIVRDALLNAGVEARRIDIRALGKNSTTDPKDRIDLIFYTDKAPQ